MQGTARKYRAAAWGREGPREVLDHRETRRGHTFAALRPRVEAARSTRTVQDPQTLQPHAGAALLHHHAVTRRRPPCSVRPSFLRHTAAAQACRLVRVVLGDFVPSVCDASCTWSKPQEEWVCFFTSCESFALVYADRSVGFSSPRGGEAGRLFNRKEV